MWIVLALLSAIFAALVAIFGWQVAELNSALCVYNLGRTDEGIQRLRDVLAKYPATDVAQELEDRLKVVGAAVQAPVQLGERLHVGRGELVGASGRGADVPRRARAPVRGRDRESTAHNRTHWTAHHSTLAASS